MSSRVSSFSDLIQRVTASCLLHPMAAGRQDAGADEDELGSSSDTECDSDENEFQGGKKEGLVSKQRVIQMEVLMEEVFEAVSTMKKAYLSLQEAHCPWDPEKMRAADGAVVAELRRLGVLRERFRRSTVSGDGVGRKRSVLGGSAGLTVRELVAPYEAAMEELKREVKVREVEVENLKEKLSSATTLGGSGKKKGRCHSQSKRKVSCIHQVASSPAPELFEATMSKVNEASRGFTYMLLSLMRSAHWDIGAAVRSIDAGAAMVPGQHAKHALESYVSRKMFQGFDHETFYMDGSLSSLLNPGQYRRDCFAQYRDMKAMEPAELLGVLPTCNFGKFCSAKYLAIVHPKMEESLFGDLEQRRQVLAGGHPRSDFYGEFLGLAKAVWLLHLLAFSLDPPPCLFEASRGAEFHPQYMESVVKFSSAAAPAGQIVGFPVGPGFKLGNGSVVKARVYLVFKS